MAERQDRPSAEEIVLYEKDPATKIATITLDRADDLNAMTIDAQHRYADLVRHASIDDDVKVLVIRANGPNLGSGADLPELMDIMARPRATCTMTAHRCGSPRTPTSSTRRRDAYRYGAIERAVLRRPRRGHAQPAGLQEDQHPRGPGLLLRLALLPSRRRRHRHHVGRRAVRPRRVPLRRLRRPHVAVVLDDGRPQVHGDGLHRATVHRQGDVRLRLRQRGRAVRRARVDDGEVRAGLLPVAARPTRSSPRRPSSRSTSSTRASTWAASCPGCSSP